MWKLLLWVCMLFPTYVAAQSQTVAKSIATPELPSIKRLVPIRTNDLRPTSQIKKADRHSAKTIEQGTLTMNDLLGAWIAQYPSLVPSQLPDAGNSVTITKVDDNTILLKNFWDTGVDLKAKVDFSQNTIAIPYQKAFTHKTYGDCDIRWVTVVDKQIQGSKTKDIMGTISKDGIEFTDSWGIFVTAGENANGIFGVYHDCTLIRGNATMSCDERDNSHIEYPVLLTQKSDNLLSVLNFADHGKSIEVILNEDQSFSIASQLAFRNNSNEDYYTYAVDWNAGTTGVFIYGNGDDHTLNWGPWTIQSEKYYIGNHINGKITTDITIKYPKLPVDTFEGEGTESNPYLIKGKDELVLLAYRVNNDKELIYGSANKHTKSYLGKYFKLANDIDLEDFRLDPIGNAWSQCFAGTFDGDGKTITGLNQSINSGIAGLFGRVDTAGVIKNLKLEKADIKSYVKWTGSIAGWCLGSIQNCQVSGTVQNQAQSVTGGIAGRATNISNCNFSGTVIGLEGCVGGITGQIDGELSNSFSDATVIAASNSASIESCGGLVGALYLEQASVTNCYFAGTATVVGGTLYLGGIVGDCYKGNISQCYNVGTVAGIGSQGSTGGITGYLIGNITNCYNSGYVSQPAGKAVGGITGGINDNRNIMTGELVAHSTIRNCYTVGTVVAETAGYKPETETRETIGAIQQTAAPVIENVYYDKQMIDFGSQKYGMLTRQLTSASGPEGFPESAWIFAEGFYPRLKGLETGAIADLSVSAILLDETTPDNVYKVTKDFTLKLGGESTAGFYLDAGNGQGQLYSKGHAASFQDATTVHLTGNGKDTLFIANGKYTRSYILTITSTSDFEGEGTKANPFLIKTKADLIKLSELTSPEVKQAYRDTYFKMTNDIDLEYDEAFKGINVDPKDSNHQFYGHFDGGGFTLHRMKLTGVIWKTTPEDSEDGWGVPDNSNSNPFLGFIGRLGNGGSLSNLNIASDCTFEYWALSGAFVGSNYGGLIENCKNYADITAYSGTIGAICGTNSQLGEGTVRNCYNAGTIRAGYNCAAGIIGTNAGTVENCQNDGTIIVEKLSAFMPTAARTVAGGIVGTMNAYGKIALQNNVNTGTIQAEKRVGGICGYVSMSGSNGDVTIANNINYGTIITEDVASRGAFSGEFSASCQYVLDNNYYDGQLLPYGGSNNTRFEGINSIATSVLTKGELSNFPAEIWEMNENRYPILKLFANEEKARDASQIIVQIATGENAGNLQSDITLHAPEGFSWSLKQGSAFTLDGSTVKVPESVEKVTYDTLIATSAHLTKAIILTKLPAVPLEGMGTAEAPYLIKSAEDWNALAEYIPVTYQNMEGKHIRLANDIDFKDKAFTPMAGDGITAFEGSMDGNEKSLNNISFKDDTQGYLGVFGRIGAKGMVSDLTIGEGSISSTKAHVGGLAGEVAGTLNNCVNRANVSTTSNYAAGIAAIVKTSGKLTGCINYGEINAQTGYAAGIAAESEAGVSFEACGNEGNIEGTTTLGGIVAKANAVSCYECYNKGTITASKATAGGIIGTTTGKEDIRLTGCFNTADISATNNAAGIIGASSSTLCTIDNCHNAGNITTNATGSSAGTAGIIGVVAPASIISNCYNTGNITAEKCANVGGITGFAGAAKEETRIQIKQCYNEGTISALANNGGGICGNMTNFMTIENCYNTGSVEGTTYIGGISSNLGGANSIISNSWNAGAVTAQKNAAGGLFGTGNYPATITGCSNMGTISSTGDDEKTSCQVGGLAGMSKASFVNCYNSGRIDGKSQIGGLVGQAFNGSINQTTGVITYGTCFDHCYNSGEVTRLDTLSGNFVGDVNGKTWQYNLAEEVYALNEQSMASDSIGTLISNAEMGKLDLGTGWLNGDDYTYPMLEGSVNDFAKISAAVVVLTDEDTPSNVTQDFFVGTPEGIVWNSSSEAITIDGNKISVKPGKLEEIILTATIGDLYKDINLKLNTPTGIETTADGKVVIKKEYYTVSGIKLIKEQPERDNIYIVVRTYDDGTTENVKERY